MADVRLNELPVLAAPTDGDILHALDDADDRDKQLTMAAVRTFAQVGTATAAQGALAATALQPGSVNLGTAATASTRTVTNTAGTAAVLPTFNTAAGLVPGTTSGTTNFLRADGTWAAPPAGGGGGVSAVSGTVPIDVATGTTTPVVSIRAATTSAPGSMSGTDKTRLDGMQTGATANSTDAQLRDRGTHTGTQLAATVSDFSTAARAQTEGMLTAGTNVTLTPSGSGATRSIQISATAGGGGVSTVTGTAPIVSSGGGSPAISIVPATTSVPGSMSAADKTKLDAMATNAQLRDRSTHTGTQTAATISDFTASSRAQVEATLVAGANVTLTPSGSGATRTIAIASTAAGGGGGTVTNVTGAAPIQVASGTTTPAVSITAATTSAAGSMSGADKTKLDGIAPNATANSTDAQLRDRSTHTGTQLAATISLSGASLVGRSSAGVAQEITLGTNLSFSGTVLNATAGGGGVSAVTGTAPIVSSGGGSPAISITPASFGAAGSMSLADFAKLNAIAPGATANSTDAQLRDRGTHTGTQTAATISDFSATSRAQTEAMLTAGTNVTLTPSGSGATRSIQISATAGGGGVSTVTGTAPIVSSGGGSPAISINAATTSLPGSMSAADKTKLDTLTAGANGTVTSVTGTAPIQVATGASTPAISITAASGSAPGSMSAGDFTKLAGVATGATISNLGYTAGSRTVTNSGGTSAVLPLFGTDAGLVPGTASSTTNFLRADGTWAAPPGGGGGVAQVTATSPLVVSGTATNPDIGILLAAFSLLGRATGTVGVPSALTLGAGLWFSGSTVAVNRTVTDTWYAATIAKGTATLGSTAIASGASAAVVTVAAAGVATTDVIDWGFNGNPNVVTGYNAANTAGCLVITAYPTAGNVNFVVSNPTAASITPGALTLNWTVVR